MKHSKPPEISQNNRTCRILHEADIREAVQWTMLIARDIGFNETVCCMIGTAVSELATNIKRYAKKGGVIHISEIQHEKKTGIEITATDKGPGIQDLGKAMKDYYSTLKGSLGIGLPGAKRLMDEFLIKSDTGTTIIIKKWLK